MATPQPLPLFKTQKANGRLIYRFFAGSIFVCICAIWTYRVRNLPGFGEDGIWTWIGMFLAELWFGFYWILTQAARWNPIFRYPFKERLSQRFEDGLPAVDVFVCTADAAIEPPFMVANTVLSVMAYDYPPDKLNVYLSDDGASAVTFFALFEASKFAKHWLPYCKRYLVEPRSPAAYFNTTPDSCQGDYSKIKKLYNEMEIKIKAATEFGCVPEGEQEKHKGFSHWDSVSSQKDHDAILQILINGRSVTSTDYEGCRLPTLVYLAREKRPVYHHNFKAGAMNALIRVSSGISNGDIILNVDCDMYSNDSQAIRDALCFFMDEENGSEIAFLQHPQNFENITQNDIYSHTLRVHSQVEFLGLDAYGGPLYIGTGCFQRREALCGLKYIKGYKNRWNVNCTRIKEDTVALEENLRALASCTYEINTLWGKEMGLKYGCPVEDVITGLTEQCRGWKSVYYNPARKAFLGLAPTTLSRALVQHKRWSEGHFQIILSRYNAAIYGYGKIKFALQMCYCIYGLWSPNCLATIFYSLVPSLALLKNTALFPKVWSPWFWPFAYVIVAETSYSIGEFLWAGGSFKGWWNDQRMWLYKRVTSYLFAFIDSIFWVVGLGRSAFVITAKVSDEEVEGRYDREIIDFGASNPMFIVLATLALVNLICFTKKVVSDGKRVFETVDIQVCLCVVLILVNLPLHGALFVRRDSGRMPISITLKSMILAILGCIFYTYS
ncbi:hypothetical protein QQ045_018345 [Rhodiola kirilowii]